jgi:cellulose biosynthesis protein BcsQ
MSDQVSVILAAPVLDTILQKMYPVFNADQGRFRVASIAANWQDLERNVRNMKADVVLVEADVANSPQQLAQFLAAIPGVALVVLPPGWAQAEGTIRAVDKVREVFIGPHVNYGEIAQKVYSAAVTERALHQSAAPMEGMYGMGGVSSTQVVGLKVFAFYASKGGTGKTTLASNFAYELNRVGVRTLLMGFDTPDDVGVQLKLKRAPNSMNYYRRPGPEGFQASIQKKDDLHVILSPNDFVLASQVAQNQHPGTIQSLIQTAWTSGYGAIVMDLPPTEEAWAIAPLLLANTLILVALPGYTDQVKTVQTIKLLTETLAGQHRIPKENIFIVLNQFNRETDNLLPDAFHQGAASFLEGWFPPVLTTIPFSPRVRPLQNEGKMPIVFDDAFGGGVRSLISAFYPNLSGGAANAVKQAAGKGLSLFGLKLKVT